MNFRLRFLIREYIKEQITQHENFNNKDLTKIGGSLVNKLQSLGFIIKKSSVSFKNAYCFDAEKLGNVYQVNIRKKLHSINEDSVEKFDRNELKKLFPDMFKNVQQSTQQQQRKNVLNSTINNNNNLQKKNVNNDDTVPLNHNDVFFGNIQYTIEFQDKSKDYNIALQTTMVFNSKENKFDNFINQIVDEIIKKLGK